MVLYTYFEWPLRWWILPYRTTLVSGKHTSG